MSVSSDSIRNSDSDSLVVINDGKFPLLGKQAKFGYENDLKPPAPKPPPVRPRNPRESSLESPRKKTIQPAILLDENTSFMSSFTTLDRLDELSYDDSSIIEKKIISLQKVGVANGKNKRRKQRINRNDEPPLTSVDDVNGSPSKQKNVQNKKAKKENVIIVSTKSQVSSKLIEQEGNKMTMIETDIDDIDRKLNAYAVNRGKFKLGRNVGFQKEFKKSSMVPNSIVDIDSVDLKAAAWKMRYYIELFRHKFNQSVFTRMKERFNANFTGLRQ